MRSLVRTLHWGLLGQLTLIACRPGANHAASRAPATQVASPVKAALQSAPTQPARPPAFTFVAPEAWRSRRPGVAPLGPPDLDQETWRVLVTQNQPLQTKTPLWQALPARETVELQMPAGSGFRCIVTPVRVSSDANTWGTKLKAWGLARSVLCSGDGWRSWTESIHRERVLLGAPREVVPDSGLLLRERGTDGVARHSFVLMRSDKEKREATTGPPRILAGVPAEDD